jgi:hypothetical protein
MFDKVRIKVANIIPRLLNKNIVKDFVEEFLPKDRYLEIKLREICSQCPLYDKGKGHSSISPSDRGNIDMCRRRYFGLLLQSFVGKPGDEETIWLYSYLKRCEDCLLSGSSK